ncbi:MAG: hypothetical protein HYZ34_04935 [Ignavibacteriae bacterium]|nr:hypothetical protein [Ignavibacteriota bacterium]
MNINKKTPLSVHEIHGSRITMVRATCKSWYAPTMGYGWNGGEMLFILKIHHQK